MSAARASKKSTATNSSKAAKKAASKKAAAKKTASTKATAKKAATKKTTAKKSPAKKAPAKKAAAKKAATKAPAKKKAAKATSTTKKAAASKAAATEKPASPASAKKAPAPKKALKLPKFLTDAAWLKSQRELLLQERGKYIQNAEALAAEAHSLMADREPGDVQFDEESGEGDTLAVERDRDLALSAKAREKVDDIDASLARIDAGTYGVCMSGEGDFIPKERLEFIPEAAKCVQHQTSMF